MCSSTEHSGWCSLSLILHNLSKSLLLRTGLPKIWYLPTERVCKLPVVPSSTSLDTGNKLLSHLQLAKRMCRAPSLIPSVTGRLLSHVAMWDWERIFFWPSLPDSGPIPGVYNKWSYIKHSSFQDALLLRVFFPSLSMPTVNYSWRLYFPELNMLWLPPIPQNKYTHRKHYDSLSKYILGVTASQEKLKNNWLQVKGGTTLWLKL